MISVLDALFRPIARLCISRGLTFADVSERLRLQFLKAAEAMADGDKVTDSRLSVMTGLQRRDIARLRDLPENGHSKAPPLARLILLWSQTFGRDVVTRGAFDDLARSVRKDVHPRTLLEELIAAGAVRTEGTGLVLQTDSYQPQAGSADQLNYLARNGGDFLAASVANVITDPPPHFEQAAHFNQLSEGAVTELRALYRQEQMALLRKLSDRAISLQDRSKGPHRFRAGGYFYQKDEGDA